MVKLLAGINCLLYYCALVNFSSFSVFLREPWEVAAATAPPSLTSVCCPLAPRALAYGPGLQLSCLQYYMGPTNGTSRVQIEDGCVENPKYYNYVAVLSLIATIMLVQVSHMVKLTLMLLIAGAVAVINIYAWRPIFDEYDRRRFQEHE